MTSRFFTYPSLVLTRTGTDDRVFTISEREQKTYGDFYCAVNGWKQAFLENKTCRAAIYFVDLFDSAAALFGALAAGVTAVLPADTSEVICQHLEGGLVDAAAGDFPAGLRLPRIKALASTTPCRDTLDETAPLIELFTSGSTGTPSRIVKRLSQLFCETQSIETRSGDYKRPITEETVCVSTVSQQHIYGLLFFLLWTVSAARKAWHERIENPETLIEVIARFPKVMWVGSPAHLKRLPEHLDWDRVRENISTIFSSGGPISEPAVRHVIALTGQSPLELLGSSESGGIAERQRFIQSDGTMGGTVWRGLPTVQWKVENDLLVLKSPQLSSPDWVVTTDRVRAGADGKTFEHLGRADRIIKVEEKRISLTLVENTLVESGLVSAAKGLQLADERNSFAVVAVPTPKGRELLKNQGKKALNDALRAVLLKVIERVCLPRYWRYADAIPENNMGKTTVAASQALFEDKAVQYVLEARTENSADAIVWIPADSPFFEGHFPEFSILPGVTQIEWMHRLAGSLFGISLHFSGLKNLKFTQPIRPNRAVTVHLEYSRDTGRVLFEISSAAEGKHAKGSLCYG